MDRHSPLDPTLSRFLLELDAFDDMCSLDARHRPVPDASLVERMLDAAGTIQDHADALLGPLSPAELATA